MRPPEDLGTALLVPSPVGPVAWGTPFFVSAAARFLIRFRPLSLEKKNENYLLLGHYPEGSRYYWNYKY